MKANPDGLHNVCKECRKARERQRHREKMADPVKAEAERARGREKMRRKREVDADGVRAYQRQWRAANPGKGAAYGRKSYRQGNGAAMARARRAANPELYIATDRSWRERNPGKVSGYSANYRALKLNASTGVTIDYPAIYATHDDCYLCGRALTNPMHMDHVVPLSKGGSHTTSNLLPTHARCNLRKNDALLSELSWYQGPTDLGHTL
jgi:5-methylcytosine-specific restriction endonuclease McrA